MVFAHGEHRDLDDGVAVGEWATQTATGVTAFYDIDGGEIRIDGRPIESIRKADLRRQLGMVLQDTYIFSGTIADNIRYGRLEATDEEVREAARLAPGEPLVRLALGRALLEAGDPALLPAAAAGVGQDRGGGGGGETGAPEA